MAKTTRTKPCMICNRELPASEVEPLGKTGFCIDQDACKAYRESLLAAAATEMVNCPRCHRDVPVTSIAAYRKTCDDIHKDACDAAYTARREAEEAEIAVRQAEAKARFEAEEIRLAALAAAPYHLPIHIVDNLGRICCGGNREERGDNVGRYIALRDDASDTTNWCPDCIRDGAGVIANEEAEIAAKANPTYIEDPRPRSQQRPFYTATASTGGDWADERE